MVALQSKMIVVTRNIEIVSYLYYTKLGLLVKPFVCILQMVRDKIHSQVLLMCLEHTFKTIFLSKMTTSFSNTLLQIQLRDARQQSIDYYKRPHT